MTTSAESTDKLQSILDDEGSRHAGGHHFTNPTGDQYTIPHGESIPLGVTYSGFRDANNDYIVSGGSFSSKLEELMKQVTTPYTGATDVSITEEQQNLIDLINRMVTGEEGRFKSLLSGEPNTGLLDRGVFAPARREMREHTLPGLADIYSGGVFGDSGYYSGDRRRAQGEALTDQGDLFAQLRYQADVEAQNKALQAGGQLPGMMGIEDLERQNDVLNLQRAIDVHYRNQGLSVQDAQLDLQATMADMDLAKYEDQLERMNDAEDDNAGLGGILGSLGGGGLGWLAGSALAPATGGMSLMAPLMGMSTGAGIGGGIGQYLGGSPNTGYANVSSGIQGLLSQMMMMQMMQGGGGMGNSVLNQPLGGVGGYDPYYTGGSYGMYPNSYGGF